MTSLSVVARVVSVVMCLGILLFMGKLGEDQHPSNGNLGYSDSKSQSYSNLLFTHIQFGCALSILVFVVIVAVS
ncbi:hypothetical protein [Pajaroellobacter abortibovis]|uniref:Uncharacterized protein n=1 Tax=Pajaroellobacter abortibovis TaxID=1882918 RepID=A0A1L6MXD8_9BACT|nr:hypothetical protein [Pajaroellobacter abortibovis]APS00214.1 hypothetical protein BCY86_05605 [Pajaroellobacter abortibovis]